MDEQQVLDILERLTNPHSSNEAEFVGNAIEKIVNFIKDKPSSRASIVAKKVKKICENKNAVERRMCVQLLAALLPRCGATFLSEAGEKVISYLVKEVIKTKKSSKGKQKGSAYMRQEDLHGEDEDDFDGIGVSDIGIGVSAVNLEDEFGPEPTLKYQLLYVDLYEILKAKGVEFLAIPFEAVQMKGARMGTRTVKGDVVKKSVSDLLQMAKESASELDRLRKLPKQDQIYEQLTKEVDVGKSIQSGLLYHIQHATDLAEMGDLVDTNDRLERYLNEVEDVIFSF